MHHPVCSVLNDLAFPQQLRARNTLPLTQQTGAIKPGPTHAHRLLVVMLALEHEVQTQVRTDDIAVCRAVAVRLDRQDIHPPTAAGRGG